MPKVSAAHLESRREQILDAAVACFAREGFHRASMQDVCREAGLSAGAIYRYFASKDDIVEAIAAERHARERGFIEAAQAARTPAETVRVLGRSFFRSLDDADEHVRRRVNVQLWAEALRDERVAAQVRRGVEPPRAVIARLLRAGQEAGEVRGDVDPESAARALQSLFFGFVLQQAWDADVDVESYLGAVEALMDGMAPRQGRGHEVEDVRAGDDAGPGDGGAGAR